MVDSSAGMAASLGFCCAKKSAWWNGGFAGCFGKNGVNFVVLLWFFCGGLRGKRGEFLTPFCVVKNGTGFSTLFFGGDGRWSREPV
jgi:hypothetical protein